MKIEVIGEIANAHQGSVKTAINLAKAAYLSKADSVKFQVYFAHEMLSPDHPRFEHFKKHKVEPVLFNFRHRYFWDGGIQCITQDLYREGKMEDYFG